MTVFRTFDMILVAIMICAAGITYKVKYDALKRIGEVQRIERQIVAEKNTINLLHAEWAMMIEPERMQVLATRYQDQLGLQVTEPCQTRSKISLRMTSLKKRIRYLPATATRISIISQQEVSGHEVYSVFEA